MNRQKTKWLGKIIGGTIAFFISGGNILAIIVGVVIGHMFDAGYFRGMLANLKPNLDNNQYVQNVFFNTTFMIMGYLAKSDGHVSEQEITAARHIMRQMHLNEKLKREAIQCFYRGKRRDFDLEMALHELRQACGRHPSLLRTFLEIQVQMAQAEGYMTPAKQAALQDICSRLGVTMNFNHYQQRRSYQRHSYQSNQQQQQTQRSNLSTDYELLEIKPSATDAEVKKAYRRMMSKYHPDRLIAKGVPQEMINIATQKTQEIKAAFERIKKTRGTV